MASERTESPLVLECRGVTVRFGGLAALDAVDASALRGYHLWPAARADFLRRLGRWAEAAVEYRRALELADNVREQQFLATRLAACEAGGENRS